MFRLQQIVNVDIVMVNTIGPGLVQHDCACYTRKSIHCIEHVP